MRAIFLLPYNGAVVAGAFVIAGIEDDLLEIVDVGKAAFLQAHILRAVGVAPGLGEIARQRVLAAEGDFAKCRRIEADPGIAVEDGVAGIKFPGGEFELILQFRNDFQTRQPDGGAKGQHMVGIDAPAIAGEPGGLEADGDGTFAVLVVRIAECGLDQAVEMHGCGLVVIGHDGVVEEFQNRAVLVLLQRRRGARCDRRWRCLKTLQMQEPPIEQVDLRL